LHTSLGKRRKYASFSKKIIKTEIFSVFQTLASEPLALQSNIKLRDDRRMI
jgi:hypothetical protein